MAKGRVSDDIGWRELGWGMVLAGAILLAISIAVGANEGIVSSSGITVGGLLAVRYAAAHADPSSDRDAGL